MCIVHVKYPSQTKKKAGNAHQEALVPQLDLLLGELGP